MKKLEGKVALVAGATRGAGRGIARALGEAGAIVYCSGRSTREHPATPGRRETIEETAEMIGANAIAVRTDHRDVDQVRALIGRIRDEQGRLDVLVNDIWGGDAWADWWWKEMKFWKIPTTAPPRPPDARHAGRRARLSSLPVATVPSILGNIGIRCGVQRWTPGTTGPSAGSYPAWRTVADRTAETNGGSSQAKCREENRGSRGE